LSIRAAARRETATVVQVIRRDRRENTNQMDRRRALPDRPDGEVAVPEQVIVSMAEIAESARERVCWPWPTTTPPSASAQRSPDLDDPHFQTLVRAVLHGGEIPRATQRLLVCSPAKACGSVSTILLGARDSTPPRAGHPIGNCS
jgi:hypothetical protein